MKRIKIICIFFLNVNLLSGQSFCKTDDVLKEFLVTEITYHVDTTVIDLTNVFKNNQAQYLGYIGKNKKRIDFHLTSIKLDSKDSNCYLMEGKTDVYPGCSRHFTGKMNVDVHFKYSESLNNEVTVVDVIEKQGFSILSYELKENCELSATGIFRGKVFVSWYLDTSGIIHYDDVLDYIPRYSNCQFIGTWTSFKTGKSKPVAWGQHRILCSGDLDVGAAEFMPNPKYSNVGWGDYSP
jgi:hypothetical protein